MEIPLACNLSKTCWYPIFLRDFALDKVLVVPWHIDLEEEEDKWVVPSAFCYKKSWQININSFQYQGTIVKIDEIWKSARKMLKQILSVFKIWSDFLTSNPMSTVKPQCSSHLSFLLFLWALVTLYWKQ